MLKAYVHGATNGNPVTSLTPRQILAAGKAGDYALVWYAGSSQMRV